MAEDVVWRRDIDELLGKLPENVRAIWHYAFTEMFKQRHRSLGRINNWRQNHEDCGDGENDDQGQRHRYFSQDQQELELLDERHAIFELSRGS